MAATGMTRGEFVEAMIYAKIAGPLGGSREDAYALMQMQAMFAAHRGESFDPHKFMDWLEKPPETVWTEEDEEPYDPETDE